MENNQLIQKTILGSIFEQYRKKLMETISWHASYRLRHIVSDEDIFQDAFIDACKRLNYLNERSDIPILVKLRVIVIQTIINKERHYKTRNGKNGKGKLIFQGNTLSQAQTTLLAGLAGKNSTPSKKAIREEQAAIINQILNEMKPNDRDIILMYQYGQMSFNECAMALRINVDAAKMRYFRAIERFKKMYEARLS